MTLREVARQADRRSRPRQHGAQAILRDIFKTRTIKEWVTFADEHTIIAPANTLRVR
jgi:hypothetical protein